MTTAPLRIVHCDFQRGWGGGQNQVWELLRGLRSRGHAQWLVTRPNSMLGERAREAGFVVVDMRFRGEVNPLAIGELAHWLRRLRPDLVATHDSHSVATAALAARCVRPRPAIVGHRRVEFPIRPGLASRWKYAQGPDHLIAVSRRARDRLIRAGVAPERIEVVYSGVVLPDAAGDASAPAPQPSLCERVGAEPGSPLIVTIANLIDPKDHPTLLAAAAALRPRERMPQWIVCGGGSQLEEIRTEVARRGLSARVHYLGFVPAARTHLPGADVFVLSSKTEGLGSSILDAMAAGVPVAATAAGGIPEMIDQERTGLLAPIGDAAALAAAVDRLLDDPALAARLAAAARERVRDFDIARIVERTEAVYRAVLMRRGR
ncbi:MAG: glycosyltransferase [Gemmatimonadota bacterium]